MQTKNDSSTHPYYFIYSEITKAKIEKYQQDLINGDETAGLRLELQLEDKDIQELTTEEFVECLIHSKEPNICAEATEFDGDKNWNEAEVNILGDISCVVKAKAYDNGAWSQPEVHENPLDVTLIYLPGALLETNFSKIVKPDFNEVVKGGRIDFEAYYQLYERRLLPGLLHANRQAEQEDRTLLITLPGIGCGQFAGEFQFTADMHLNFQKVIERILEKYGQELTQVKAIWYDNYNKSSAEKMINGINFHVKPLIKGGKPQLCEPQQYSEEYKNCDLVSFVAWDPVSLPGNDYWIGNRTTDDGVKGAASNTMAVLTGVEGVYNAKTNKFVCKESPSTTWAKVLEEKGIIIPVKDSIISYGFPNPVLSSVIEGIEKRVKQLEKGSSFFKFSVGKKKKADLINEALSKVKDKKFSSTEEFLNYRDDGAKSLNETLNHNRLFIHRSKTKTFSMIEEVINNSKLG